MKKKFDKILLVKVFFVLIIFLSALNIQDEKTKVEIIKAGIGVISAFMMDYTRKEIKEKTKPKE